MRPSRNSRFPTPPLAPSAASHPSRRTTPAFGTHGVGTTASKVIQGDISIAKYFLKTHPRQDLTLPLLGGADFKGQAQVDEWIEYTLKCKGAAGATGNKVGYNELLETVEETLAGNNSMFLCGNKLTLADLVGKEQKSPENQLQECVY